MPQLERERTRTRRFGFCSLFAWALLGFCLEAAHAFKLSSYLDHPARRELLVWGHAHGVGLALVLLAYAAQGVVDQRSASAGPRLRFAAALMPLAFVLSVLGQSESDPGPAIWLVPAAAAVLLWGLFDVALASLRARD
ncbi:MAG: hypothetical protein QM778_09055 [Myxococcales bacterium]